MGKITKQELNPNFAQEIEDKADSTFVESEIQKVNSTIGQIANDRGYLNSKSLGSDINLDTFFIPGRYYSSTCLGRPNSDAFIIDVGGVTSANSAITQKATCYYGAGNVNFGKTYGRTYYLASGGWTPWKEITTMDRFTPVSQNLVVTSSFEVQGGASPFSVTKNGQMLYFLGQIKCLMNTTTSPVVLAVSPLKPLNYSYIDVFVNNVRIDGLVVAPDTGNIYIYRNFITNDVINFRGLAIGKV